MILPGVVRRSVALDGHLTLFAETRRKKDVCSLHAKAAVPTSIYRCRRVRSAGGDGPTVHGNDEQHANAGSGS